jgi:hypothetical protein
MAKRRKMQHVDRHADNPYGWTDKTWPIGMRPDGTLNLVDEKDKPLAESADKNE